MRFRIVNGEIQTDTGRVIARIECTDSKHKDELTSNIEFDTLMQDAYADFIWWWEKNAPGKQHTLAGVADTHGYLMKHTKADLAGMLEDVMEIARFAVANGAGV